MPAFFVDFSGVPVRDQLNSRLAQKPNEVHLPLDAGFQEDGFQLGPHGVQADALHFRDGDD